MSDVPYYCTHWLAMDHLTGLILQRNIYISLMVISHSVGKSSIEIHLLVLLSREFLNIAEDCGRLFTSEQRALSYQETDFFLLRAAHRVSHVRRDL